MNMMKTNHAIERIQQRGIPAVLLDLVEDCGKSKYVQGGREKIYLSKKDIQSIREKLKKMIQVLDKASGLTMIVEGNYLITSYKED
jgi:hypothetical protein